ncbi:MAG TPA: type IV pilus secretin PilQ, partial [Candidatus Tenderia electrophaga]|nr:type IV pilus secretin PilQ [Candidatus Tenderia electrophaga]
ERTNTLLVRDTISSLEEIHRLIAKLDIPVRQVLIEARLVIANSSYNKDIGARFGVSRDTLGDSATGSGSQFSGTLGATDQLINNETLTAPGRLNVDLPANPETGSAASFAMSFVKLPFGTNIDLELSAMVAEGQGEVVSSPRLITANQKEAFIEQGVEIAYQQNSGSVSGATTTSFKKAVLSLKVTPQITPDDRVIMDLQINKDSVGDIYEGVPSINTREINTQVLVENGETVVLGGVYEEATNDGISKVPFLGDLPLIGALFRSTVKRDSKEELLVFITPKIIKEGLSIN